jgi:hypothetical protein
MEQSKKRSVGAVLAQKCALGCFSCSWQLLVAIAFVVGCLALVAVALEALDIIDISGVPPGLAYVPFRHQDGTVYRKD